MKNCTKCRRELPATTEYFNRNTSSWDGLRTWCKDCSRAHYKEYRAKNRDKLNREARAYHQEHREDANERRRAHYQAHRDEATSSMRNYYRGHKDESRSRCKAWKEANPEKVALSARRSNRKRRQKQVSTYHASVKEFKHSDHCFFCGRSVSTQVRVGSSKKATIEHLLPLERGGEDHILNLVTTCTSCNCSKRDLTIDEYAARELGRELVPVLGVVLEPEDLDTELGQAVITSKWMRAALQAGVTHD